MHKLVIFDFDGTIADSMWAWDALGRETLSENDLPPLKNYDDVIRTMSVPHFSQYLSQEYPQLGTAEQLLAVWHEKMVYNYLNKVKLKEGIIEFLDYLKFQKYTIYLASATHYKILSKALIHFELIKYFDFIITEEVVGVSKRDPKIYNVCAQKAGVKVENIYLFEDAVHAVKTATQLGVNVCAISDFSMRGFVKEVRKNCRLYLDDFTDLKVLKEFLKD